MSWDFDFEDGDGSFASGFDGADAMFMAGTDSVATSTFENPFSQDFDFSSNITTQPLQQISLEAQTTSVKASQISQSNLQEENNQLRQFFSSLKEKAEQAESLNQSLKTQLEDCRSWFKNAMFSGIANHK